MSPGRLKQCCAARGCPATGVPHTQPGSGGAVSPSPMDGRDGAGRMPPAAHAFAVPMAGREGADRSVRGAPAPAVGTAALSRARLLARLLAQARMAAVKQPAAGAGSTLRQDRRILHGHLFDAWVQAQDRQIPPPPRWH